MKTRILVAAIGLPLLLAVLLLLPPWGTAVLFAAICAVGAHELTVCVAPDRKCVRLPAMVWAGLAPLGTYFLDWPDLPVWTLFTLLAAVTVIALAVYEKEEASLLPGAAAAVFAGAVIPTFLSYMVLLRSMDAGRVLVLLPFVCVFTSDSGGYFVGMFLGKRHPLPKLSPKKTVAGFVGSFLCGTACVCLYFFILSRTGHTVRWGGAVLCGVLGNLFCQTGDLAFSLIKRCFGIKDYGRLLPGHGGVLDRFDSLVFAAPVIYFVVTRLGVLS